MNIEITLHEISWGSESITMRFGEKEIKYDPTYVGAESISSLIESVIALGEFDCETVNTEISRYHLQWDTEPGTLYLNFYRNKKTNIVLLKTESDSKELHGLEINFNFQDYKDAVIKEALRVLKLYGLSGFNRNWCDGMDVFPINSLLTLLRAKTDFDKEKDTFHSDIFSELEILRDALIKQ